MSAERIDADNERLELLKRMKMTLKSLQIMGEDSAESRSHHIDSWVRDYLDTMTDVPDWVKQSKINDHMKFFDSATMNFADWQDKIALMPLSLAVEGYPELDSLSRREIDLLLETAGGMGSERHDADCFLTGVNTVGCFASAHICSSKSVLGLGKDLAAQLVLQELGCIYENNVTGMKKAKENVRSIQSMFAYGGLMTEESFEEMIDRWHHDFSIYFRPDMYEHLNTD